jgi:hypothetical protein
MVNSRIRAARRLAIAVAAIALTGVSHNGMDIAVRSSADRVLVPPSDYARLMALGFDAAVSDFYWMRAVQLSGSLEPAAEPAIADLMEVVTDLNPWVDHPYRFTAVWLTGTPETVERANRVLEKGIAHHPRDWRNRYHLGFNQFFYLERPLVAAETLEGALGLPGAPRYLPRLIARLRSSGGGIETASTFLRHLLETTQDEYEKAEYLKALDEIEVERRARFLDGAREEFWRRNGRDIARVTELLEGSAPVLRELPRAQMHLDGFTWELDEQGRIVSTFYRNRYQLHVTDSDRARQKRWREMREQQQREDTSAGGAV